MEYVFVLRIIILNLIILVLLIVSELVRAKKDDDLIYGSMILWETVVEVHLNVDVQIVFITND